MCRNAWLLAVVVVILTHCHGDCDAGLPADDGVVRRRAAGAGG